MTGVKVKLVEAQVRSFSPIARSDARILILGSMPGRASLDAQRYYAHPQNSFWRIMAELLHFEAGSYEERIELLKSRRIAVWDVLHSCIREGSLDSNIQSDMQVANDFAGFFRKHRQITHVFFNGAMANACFKRHVLPELATLPLNYLQLPSTSPANASSSYLEKVGKWAVILQPLKTANL
jgi:hypoxanthine-DNA glycosylase